VKQTERQYLSFHCFLYLLTGMDVKPHLLLVGVAGRGMVSGGPTVLANDRNGGRLRLNASRHDDDDDATRGTIATDPLIIR